VHYGIRPTDLQLADSGIAAQVVVIEPTGAETELLVEVGGQQLVVVMHGRTTARPDDTVHLRVDTDKAHVFDGRADSGCSPDDGPARGGDGRQRLRQEHRRPALADGAGRALRGRRRTAPAGERGAHGRRHRR
jgi:hypothetical protein